jgi:hypothetical protein
MLKTTLNSLTFIWYIFITILIILGWNQRDQRYLVAESGIGYWFGILGGLLMLILLIYPLRKRISHWRFIGSIKLWFRLHMFFGIMGPVLIIFHSGFRLASLNGKVAFSCMLLVAFSGLIGRYFYRRIHHGLYGKKVSFKELYHIDEDWEKKFTDLNELEPKYIGKLYAIEQSLVNKHSAINRSLWFFITTKSKLNRLRREIRKNMPASKNRKEILTRLSSLKKIPNLGVNEILFSYWHIFHFPFFLLMIMSGIFHVFVVHFY